MVMHSGFAGSSELSSGSTDKLYLIGGDVTETNHEWGEKTKDDEDDDIHDSDLEDDEEDEDWEDEEDDEDEDDEDDEDEDD